MQNKSFSEDMQDELTLEVVEGRLVISTENKIELHKAMYMQI